jgi:linoleate 10R-lipoxygenase
LISLTRDAEGYFSDDDIARILLDATQTPGGAWRARGTPESLRIVEILGIEQARQWGVCTVRFFPIFIVHAVTSSYLCR